MRISLTVYNNTIAPSNNLKKVLVILRLRTQNTGGSSRKKVDDIRRVYSHPLTPIRKVDNHYIDPNALPDPQFLLRLYGAGQIQQALDEYDLPVLKKTVAQLKKLHPKTKPKASTQRYDLIDYIVEMTREHNAFFLKSI